MKNFHIYIILCVVDFTKSEYVQYVMKKSIYLVCRQNCPKTCLSGVSWDLFFIYSSLKLPGKGTVFAVNVIIPLCGHC